MAQCPYTTAREDPMMQGWRRRVHEIDVVLTPRSAPRELGPRRQRTARRRTWGNPGAGDRIARPIGCAHARSWPTSSSGSATWVSPRVMCTTKRRPRPSKSSRSGSACPPQVSPTSPPVGGSGRGHHLRRATPDWLFAVRAASSAWTTRRESHRRPASKSSPFLYPGSMGGISVVDRFSQFVPGPTTKRVWTRRARLAVMPPRRRRRGSPSQQISDGTSPNCLSQNATQRYRPSLTVRALAGWPPPATLRALVNDAPGVIVPSSAIEGW